VPRYYPPKKRRKPELPFPTEGQVFWIFFWIMLPLLILEAWWCSRTPEPQDPPSRLPTAQPKE
jgi:hypothetical protein